MKKYVLIYVLKLVRESAAVFAAVPKVDFPINHTGAKPGLESLSFVACHNQAHQASDP